MEGEGEEVNGGREEVNGGGEGVKGERGKRERRREMCERYM